MQSNGYCNQIWINPISSEYYLNESYRYILLIGESVTKEIKLSGLR